MNTIETKLQELIRDLHVPKNQRNTFGNFNYRSAEDIIESVKPLLGEAILQLTDEVVQVGDRYYVRATATLRLGSESVTAVGWAREAEDKKGMDAMQLSGACSSYARKYALGGLLLLDDAKDADYESGGGGKVEEPDPVTDDQITEIDKLAALIPLSDEDLHRGVVWASGAKASNISDLSAEQAARLVAMMNKKLGGAQK